MLVAGVAEVQGVGAGSTLAELLCGDVVGGWLWTGPCPLTHPQQQHHAAAAAAAAATSAAVTADLMC